jgi:hypothetical protein
MKNGKIKNACQEQLGRPVTAIKAAQKCTLRVGLPIFGFIVISI